MTTDHAQVGHRVNQKHSPIWHIGEEHGYTEQVVEIHFDSPDEAKDYLAGYASGQESRTTLRGLLLRKTRNPSANQRHTPGEVLLLGLLQPHYHKR